MSQTPGMFPTWKAAAGAALRFMAGIIIAAGVAYGFLRLAAEIIAGVRA